VTTPRSSASSRRTASRPEIEAALAFAAKLPPLDAKVMLKATWDAARLAHRVGVTTFADLSFGTLPGGDKAYETVAADPNFPLRIVLNPVIQVFSKTRGRCQGRPRLSHRAA
jgi:hypothetical protein